MERDLFSSLKFNINTYVYIVYYIIVVVQITFLIFYHILALLLFHIYIHNIHQ